MSYVDEHLLAGEEVVYQTRQHWTIFTLPALVFLLGVGLLVFLPRYYIVGVAVVGLALLLLIPPLVRFVTSEYAVTNKRVIVKLGLVQREASETLLSKVEAIAVDQTIPGRLLGYGTVIITGTGGTREGFPRITDPMEFRRQLQAQIVAMEERRAVPVGAGAPVEVREERECPWCAEKILRKARVCRFCGREVVPET